MLFDTLAVAEYCTAANSGHVHNLFVSLIDVQLNSTMHLSAGTLLLHPFFGYRFLPRDALQCKARSCYRMSSFRPSV